MKPESVFFGFLMAVAVFAVLACGFGVGATSVTKDCETLGMFRVGDTVYACNKQPEDLRGKK